VPTIPKGGWATIVFSNHDQQRHIDRYGKGGNAEIRARAAALLLFTLPGTPFMYYGEELGMRNAKLRYRQLRDPYTKRFWPFRPGRDPARTPMQWDASFQAGFTTGEPWLPLASSYRDLNVADETTDPRSLLCLYKRLIAHRRASSALLCGDCLVQASSSDCLLYERLARLADGTTERMLVVVNFSSRQVELILPASARHGEWILSTDPAAVVGPISRHIRLAPSEGRLGRLRD
jgi:alpha-glucosidase